MLLLSLNDLWDTTWLCTENDVTIVHESVVEDTDCGNAPTKTNCFFRRKYSGSLKVRNASHPGVTLSFCWEATGESDDYADSFNYSCDVAEDPDFVCDGFVLVDSDGAIIDPDSDEYFEDLLSLESRIPWESAVRSVLPVHEPVWLEGCDQPGNGMTERYRVSRNNGPDWLFYGECVDSDSCDGQYGRYYSEIYTTVSGVFVCCKGEENKLQGQPSIKKAAICHTEDEIEAFFSRDVSEIVLPPVIRVVR